MPCSVCHLDKPLKARAMCRTCYARWQKNGTTEYKRWGKKTTCTVEGCGETAKAGGLCPKHYQRMQKHGSLEQRRGFPPEWGPITQHPLFVQWEQFHRKKGVRLACAAWAESFPQFLADVGERPSLHHRLYVLNHALPIGPGNFEWRERPAIRQEGERREDFEVRYAAAYKVAYADVRKDRFLRRSFGDDLTYARYMEMFDAQDGKCAICREPEKVMRHGKVAALAVDHDHITGAVRGLLCHECNTGLGKFRDSASILTLAIAYLEKHGAAK